ncbi:LADA_0C06326g1_1 [Lachancea dasiensis]|uniref:LADA_0C06326g1_1 n=1 Tax=Lachancea dasiensis TaxID=1072105 RepID=A0A1G4IZ54_9SACH|nr:LADA_0C06326g1_1 [Lachancea dasiensis]
MRAVPTPRKSRTRFLRRKFGQMYQIVSFRKVRKKHNLHHLHQLHRRNTRTSRQKRANFKNITTPLVIDDYVDLDSGPESPTAKRKPLLIASFPNGYGRSPRVKILQKNILSRFWISRRRYRLRKYNPGMLEFQAQRQGFQEDDCFRSCRTIRKQAAKYADVKFNFERHNVVKTVCIPIDHSRIQQPQFLEFDPEHSVRLDEIPSLMAAHNAMHEVQRPLVSEQGQGPGYVALFKRKCKSTLEELHWKASEYVPRICLLDQPDIIIMSCVKTPNDGHYAKVDPSAQTLRKKAGAFLEASRLAGSALNNYSRMLQKLETVSPGATRTLRIATTSSIAQ